MTPPELALGDVRLEPDGRRATVAGRPVALAPHELRLLETLLQHASEVVPRGDLLSRAWDPLHPPGTTSLDAMVTDLRRRLYGGGVDIVGVRGVGYQLVARTPGFKEDEGFRALFFNASAGIALMDAGGRIMQCNAALQEMVGLSADELRGRTLEQMALPGDPGEPDVPDASPSYHQAEVRLRRPDGSVIWALVSRSQVKGGGRSRFHLAMVLDITDRKRAEETLHRLAVTDELTGLYNRRGLLMLAEQQWRLARRKGQPIVLLYADLDGFKQVNDTLGHDAGDRLLVTTAGILRQCCRDSDTVGRMGGDEFIILASEAEPEGGEALRARIQERIRQYNGRRGKADPPLAASLGIVTVEPGEESSFEELLSKADERMYAEKQRKGAARGAPQPPQDEVRPST